MSESIQLVVFSLEAYMYALHLAVVERIVHAIDITPLPEAPEIVMGVINLQGSIIPVVNIRKRFHLPEREISLHDQLIIAQTSKRTVALLVDAVSGVIKRSEQDIVSAERILPSMEYVEGVAKFEDGLIYIHDLDTFLSIEEERILADLISRT